MKVIRKIFNHNLRMPDSVTVEVGKHKAIFSYEDRKQVAPYVEEIWKKELDAGKSLEDCTPAYIYYNIDWDCDHVLFARYRPSPNQEVK